MPEYPDLTIYVEALERRVLGRPLEGLRIASPSLLKTVDPRPDEAVGRRIERVHRLGKRIVFDLENGLHLALHLMIAGRLHWKKRGVAIPRKRAHAAFDFPDGSLLLTEASTKKRAALHVLAGDEAQHVYASEVFEYPVKAGVEPSDIVKSFGTLKADTLPLSEIAGHRRAASELVDRVGLDEGPGS